jgi:aryl-alcohol dehydrogenase
MQATAAILHEPDGPFSLEQVELDDLRGDELLVRIHACGVCHTDVKAKEILSLPAVFGHEGTGIVEAIGKDVTRVGPGERVLISYPWCGICPQCVSNEPFICTEGIPLAFGGTRLDGSHTIKLDGKPLSGAFFQQSSFATHAITLERDVVPITGKTPYEHLGALPCGIQTGAGAILNSLDVHPKSGLLIIGAGTVGLSATMAGKLKQASPLIVVDYNAGRLNLAAELGATATIDANLGSVNERIRELAPRGVEYALDTSGTVGGLEDSIEALSQGGVCGIVTAPDGGKKFPFTTRGIFSKGASLRGIIQGSAIANTFLPRLIELSEQGLFPYERLVTTYDFTDINKAFEDARSGRTIKPVLIM